MKKSALLVMLLPFLSFAEEFHFQAIESGLARFMVYRSILEDSSGIVWYGTLDQGVMRQSGDAFEKLIVPDIINLTGATSIHQTKDGSVFLEASLEVSAWYHVATD